MIHFEQLSFTYPGARGAALHGRQPGAAGRRADPGDRPVGLGQIDAAALPQRPGAPFHRRRAARADRASQGWTRWRTPRVLSRHVGFVFQDPEAQFVMDRVEDEIAFALENAAMPPQEMRVRVEETLDLLDLAPLRERPLKTLSGGERQRVAIAAALALRPRSWCWTSRPRSSTRSRRRMC